MSIEVKATLRCDTPGCGAFIEVAALIRVREGYATPLIQPIQQPPGWTNTHSVDWPTRCPSCSRKAYP